MKSSIRARLTGLFLTAAVLAGPAAAASLDAFAPTPNAAIAGHNVENLAQSTPEMCAAACLGAPRGLVRVLRPPPGQPELRSQRQARRGRGRPED